MPAPGKSLFLCAVAATLLAACGGSKSLVQDGLDPRTGATAGDRYQAWESSETAADGLREFVPQVN